MANPEHVEIVKQGAEAIREWREENPCVLFELGGADLFGTNLIEADLRGTNLRRVNLTEANLSRADFSGANLQEANLSGANLTQAILADATLTGTRINGTIFGDNDLSVVNGLEAVNHCGPSIISIDTLFRSKGKIPEAFLRGCGVPDELIAYLPSLIGSQQAVQFYSCFISYSHKDEEFAKRLHSRMRDEGLRVWYAPEEMKGGRKIHEQIDEAIRVHDKLLLVLSEHSMASEWVKTEIRHARRREVQEGKRILFPISLVPFDAVRDWSAFDADIGKDMGVEIREYFIPDFSDWKDHDAFEAGFKRLLDDLKAEADRGANLGGGEAK